MAASDIRRVGIIFSGGPAPGANAVIAASAGSFLEDGRIVLGFFFGYSNLQAYHPLRTRSFRTSTSASSTSATCAGSATNAAS
jgi:6-phosphofructokinase